MSLIYCPECDKSISQHTETCPNCGFPIQKFLSDNNITDVTKAFLCPKCANVYYWDDIPLKLKCEYCNTILVQTDLSMKELRSLGIWKENEEKFLAKTVELAKKYGNNQFDEDAYNNRLIELHQEVEKILQEHDNETPQKSKIKCPYCNSTNTTKITMTKRSLSTYLFGLGSSKVGKQWHCNNCKSDF